VVPVVHRLEQANIPKNPELIYKLNFLNMLEKLKSNIGTAASVYDRPCECNQDDGTPQVPLPLPKVAHICT